MEQTPTKLLLLTAQINADIPTTLLFFKESRLFPHTKTPREKLQKKIDHNVLKKIEKRFGLL
jgi:hypothetical protein